MSASTLSSRPRQPELRRDHLRVRAHAARNARGSCGRGRCRAATNPSNRSAASTGVSARAPARACSETTLQILGRARVERRAEARGRLVGKHERELEQRRERQQAPGQPIDADQHDRRGRRSGRPTTRRASASPPPGGLIRLLAMWTKATDAAIGAIRTNARRAAASPGRGSPPPPSRRCVASVSTKTRMRHRQGQRPPRVPQSVVRRGNLLCSRPCRSRRTPTWKGCGASGGSWRSPWRRRSAAVEPGVTTAELDAVAAGGARATMAPVRRRASSTASPARSASASATRSSTGSPRRDSSLRGDVVKLDVTAELGGYMADAAVTVVVHAGADSRERLAAPPESALARASPQRARDDR